MRRRLTYVLLLVLLIPGLAVTAIYASKGLHHGLPIVISNNTASTVVESALAKPLNCTVPDQGSGPSSLKLSGQCQATFTKQFQCKANVDDLYITTNAKNSDGTDFYLEINAESFTGPGDYPVTETNLLTAAPSGYPRWSGTAAARVNTNNSVDLTKVELTPVPGTGATGSVFMEGFVGCSRP